MDKNTKDIKAKKLRNAGVSVGAVLAMLFLISPWEGEVKDKQGLHIAYKDPIGIVTYCRGLTGKTLANKTVNVGDKFTEEECSVEEAFRLKEFEKRILHLVKPNNSTEVSIDSRFISQYEKAAFISFVWNVGDGNLAKSTLLKNINKGNHVQACLQLTKWVYANKKILPGLVSRRNNELDWCLGNVSWEVEATAEKIEALGSQSKQ